MGSKINKNIKPLILIALVFFIPLRNITAQTSEPRNNMSIGFQINQYQDDFGIGINATSPFFIYQKVAVRLRSNLMFNEHLKNQEATWTPYLNATVGLLGEAGWIGDSIKLYSEGGVIGLFPSETFSSESFEFGGYGLFGFEFYMVPRNNFFIEIGGVGTGARANKMINKPIYSNGLLISAGFRVHL